MPISEAAKSDAAIRRKLRALAAVLEDPTTTEPERANAERLKARLQKQLIRETSSPDTGTTIMFRLSRGVRDATVTGPNGDWTDHAFRAGKLVRGIFKK